MSSRARNPWAAVVVLASLYIFANAVELGTGNGGWPQIVGLPFGIAVAAYGVARVLGWQGVER